MKNVIVIDDNPAIGTMVARMLAGTEFNCTLLTSGEDLLDHLQGAAADLLITDILMPGVEGIEIILAVRNVHPGLPILAMSGGGHSIGTDVLRTAQQLGANAILPKPFTREDLLTAIENALAG